MSIYRHMLSIFFKRNLENMLDGGYAEKIAKEENIVLPQNKKEWIATEDVKCVSLDSLLVKYNINNIDLLIIDAEGYDYEIIKAIPFIIRCLPFETGLTKIFCVI